MFHRRYKKFFTRYILVVFNIHDQNISNFSSKHDKKIICSGNLSMRELKYPHLYPNLS